MRKTLYKLFLALMVSLSLGSSPIAQNEILKMLEALSGTASAQIQEPDEEEDESEEKKKFLFHPEDYCCIIETMTTRNFRRYITMKDKIAYCGLNCETCDAYLATIHDDQALREKTAKLWAELNNAPILPEHINCLGCREDGIKTVFCNNLCGIRQCAVKKDVTTCGDCPGLETCQLVETIISDNPEALKNLKG